MNDEGLGITTMTDLGAGYIVPMADLAQQSPQTTVVGVENCALCLFGYAASMEAPLSSDETLTNSKICYVNCDIWQLKDLDWCKIVYMFNEAFPIELVMYIYQLFMASKTTKYLITLKAERDQQATNTCWMDSSTLKKSGVLNVY